ncbi:DUF4007 family protein [Bacillus sp. SJS]|uniref:DUF4007 family protein n=1 Tax=Bacillus sp. SJS TaxID=1423321 RepID=UPI0004DCEB40|nr:DUF4007 family protein [Bacillus sp. SJS]KZZ84378.1 hypothetical protein AS29_010990 [Bacillus sp. SJS]
MIRSLNFHQSFAPERDALAQLLSLSQENCPPLTKEEISKITTISTGESSGKVVPNLLYAEMMGILDVKVCEGRYQLYPNPLGTVIKNEDPFLIESITKWICHYNLAFKNSKTVLWSYIFNEVIKQLGTSFSKESLQKVVNKNFEAQVNLTPFRSCYLNNDRSFTALELLKEEDNNYRMIPHNVEPSYMYLYAYQLLNSWEIFLEDRTEITFNEIKEKLYFGDPYVWGDREIHHVLELLHDEKIIILNRQLNPLTIVRHENSKDILNKLYSLLI